MDERKSKKLLTNRNFMFLWLGQLVSNLGNRIHSIAVMWYVLEKTGSTVKMGTSLVFTVVPMILLSPIAGPYADRWDRKKIIVITDFINGILVGLISILVLTKNLELWMLYTISAMISANTAFFNPAINAAIPSIVEKENLVKANSMNQASNYATNVFGPTIGGILLAILGIPGLFILDSVSYLISAFSESFINISKVKRKENVDVTIIDDIKEAFKYTLKNKVLLHFIIVGGFIINFFLAPLQMVITVHSRQILDLGSDGLGVLLSAIAIGSFIMSVLVPAINKRISNEVLTMIGLTGEGISIILFGMTTNFYTSFATLIILGFSIGVCNICLNTVFQTIIPNNMLGKIGGAFTVIVQGTVPLGYFMGGLLLENIQVSTISFVSGAIVALAGITTVASIKDVKTGKSVA